jgi:ParB-like nuclease domain
MGWRDHIKVHPAADLFPLMSESELRELGEDIKKNGLRYPVILWRENERKKTAYLLDGRNRLDAMELVGVPVLDGDGKLRHWSLREGEPYDLVLSLNVHRRHLTTEQKRELIAKVLKAKPAVSNATIAKQTKTTDKTVAKVRRKLESTSEIPKLEKTTGADGKQRKSRAKKTRKVLKATAEGGAGDACLVAALESERQRATGSAEVSIEQRRAGHARLDPIEDLPTEAEADESWQNDLYDQACLLLERMADATRQRFFGYLTAASGGDIVERCLSLMAAMNKEQRAQFFAKYTELSAAKLPARAHD